LIREAIIITGANRGIGREIALALAKEGRHVILACRDSERAEDAVRSIREASGNQEVEASRLDLASFESVEAFVRDIAAKGIEIGTLINNAGVLCDSFLRTEDGFERTIQINYLSMFLLTLRLLPFMPRGRGQIINTSSVMYRLGNVDRDIFGGREKTYNRFRVYADSKLASLLFCLELAERLSPEGISVNSADPGIVNTNIITMHNRVVDPLANFFFRPLIKSPKEGAQASIRLALLGEGKRVTGRYFIGEKERRLSTRYIMHPARRTLWERTERALGIQKGTVDG
jgi:retinol dehydrogenase 12